MPVAIPVSVRVIVSVSGVVVFSTVTVVVSAIKSSVLRSGSVSSIARPSPAWISRLALTEAVVPPAAVEALEKTVAGPPPELSASEYSAMTLSPAWSSRVILPPVTPPEPVVEPEAKAVAIQPANEPGVVSSSINSSVSIGEFERVERRNTVAVLEPVRSASLSETKTEEPTVKDGAGVRLTLPSPPPVTTTVVEVMVVAEPEAP